MTQPSRDELRSPELLSSTRGRVGVAALVVLALAVVAIAALRPDRQGVGTALGLPSPSVSFSPVTASTGPSPLSSELPIPSPAPTYGPIPVPPALTAKTGSRLVVVQGTRMQILDVDSGKRTLLRTDPRLAGNDRIDVVAVGRELVFLGDNQTGAGNSYTDALATTAGPGSALRAIGKAMYVNASERPGRVWLAKVDDDTISVTTMTEVDLRGHVYRHERFEGSFGLARYAGGYLRQAIGPDGRENEDVELLDANRRRRYLYKHVSVLTLRGSVAVLGDRVACQTACDLHILTAGTSVSERVLHLGATPDLIEAVLTSDGSRLIVGVPAAQADGAPQVLSELDLHTGKWRRSAAWVARYYGGSFGFSADGRWMFFVDGNTTSVDAYDLTTRQVYRVKGSFREITQLEVLPS